MFMKSGMRKQKKQTVETLPEFIKKLIEDYVHDYGTICHAVAASAIAAANAVNHSPTGGITGFQAGAVMWEFITNWMSEYKNVPLKLISYEKMLFPQYKEDFEETINYDTWKWLQEQAKKKLEAETRAHPDIKAHWESILKGNVPFGYVVKKNTC